MKQLLKTALTSFVSGLLMAAGSWAWKQCLEKKADELKQEYDELKSYS